MNKPKSISELSGLFIYPRSVTSTGKEDFFLARREGRKVLGVVGKAAGFVGERQGKMLLCPLTAENAAALRRRLPWLWPHPLGLVPSVGCGDRLGLATPGHIRAVRGSGIAPIFCQQSMRENARTGRTPQQVMDDALWGIFQEGWREPWGADADHLKTIDDIDRCAAAGYTFFTIDPGDYVGKWGNGEIGHWEELKGRYLGRRFEIEGFVFEFDERTLRRAAAKYGAAIAHTVRMYRRLTAVMRRQSFELEVSVDETETPTTPLEHLFIALELQRQEVRWVSLAPRYLGRFEKGVDYIPPPEGGLDAFDADLARHAAIARALGPYKLSIHSGSDKFSVYPLFARHTAGLVHLKTAGTSYLEALRAIAGVDPAFFRDILALARQRYETDRATYHVSAQVERVPPPETLPDADLPGLLDQFDAREVLHVTFGSVLDRYGERLRATLEAHEEAHYAALEAHFRRHLAPFGVSVDPKLLPLDHSPADQTRTVVRFEHKIWIY